MKTSEVAQLLGLSPNTVRTWTWREFRSYFSPDAQGGDGNTREFNELDIQVMSHIATLTRKHTAREDIHTDLRKMQGGNWIDLPPLRPAPSKTLSMPVVPAEAAQRELDSERRALMREVATLQGYVEKMEHQLHEERKDHAVDNDKHLRELAMLRQELGQAEEKARSARSETLVELYESGRLKPPAK